MLNLVLHSRSMTSELSPNNNKQFEKPMNSRIKKDDFYSHDHRSYWFTETNDVVCLKMCFNSGRIGSIHQYCHGFFVFGTTIWLS